MAFFRPRRIEARMVGHTEVELRELAKWCGGILSGNEVGVVVFSRKIMRGEIARPTDWIVLANNEFYVMPNDQFQASFEEIEEGE